MDHNCPPFRRTSSLGTFYPPCPPLAHFVLPLVDASVVEILSLGAVVVVPNNIVGFYSRVFTVTKTESGVKYVKKVIINLKVSFN